MMHQDTLLETLADDYLRLHFEKMDVGELHNVLRRMAIKVLKPAVEYADDNTDPLEYTDVGSSESELDYIFYDLED